MLSCANAFEISDIERMNIGGISRAFRTNNVTCPVVLLEITIRQEQVKVLWYTDEWRKIEYSVDVTLEVPVGVRSCYPGNPEDIHRGYGCTGPGPPPCN
jgi:hypothetical protein